MICLNLLSRKTGELHIASEAKQTPTWNPPPSVIASEGGIASLPFAMTQERSPPSNLIQSNLLFFLLSPHRVT